MQGCYEDLIGKVGRQIASAILDGESGLAERAGAIHGPW